MTKQFSFDYLRNSEAVYKFCHTLMHYANSQAVIHSRFQLLINKLTASNQNGANISSKKSGDVETNFDIKVLVRKSYLVPGDLQADLVESNCELFMQVKNGFFEAIPSRFLIDT